MKKTYIKPQVAAVEMESEMLIAASVGIMSGKADPLKSVLVNEMEFHDIWGN